MKKALSLFLALILAMTALFALPANAAESHTSMLKNFNNIESEAFYAKKAEITEIIFADINKVSVPADYWDVSADGDGSVKAWIVSEAPANILYIAGNGGVKAHPVSENLFNGFTALTSVGNMNLFFTDGVISTNGMFFGCSSLKEIDLSYFKTSDITTMKDMFSGCKALETVYMNNWHFHNDLQVLNGMFSGCESLSDVYIYDIRMDGNCKPYQDNMYTNAGINSKHQVQLESGKTKGQIYFHDNNNIGVESTPWDKLFAEAGNSVLIFDVPQNYTLFPSATSMQLLTGQKYNLTVKVLPRPTNSVITYESSDRSVVTVNKNGVVVAVGESQIVDNEVKVTYITVTNTTVDDGVTKVNSVEIPVTVSEPKKEDCFEITFEKPDTIEFFSVSRDEGESFIPVHGGTYRYLKGTELLIRAQGNSMSYVFVVDGKDIESDYSNRLNLVVNKNKTVTVRTIDFADGEGTLSFIEQLVKFFRDIIEWFRNLFK